MPTIAISTPASPSDSSPLSPASIHSPRTSASADTRWKASLAETNVSCSPKYSPAHTTLAPASRPIDNAISHHGKVRVGWNDAMPTMIAPTAIAGETTRITSSAGPAGMTR